MIGVENGNTASRFHCICVQLSSLSHVQVLLLLLVPRKLGESLQAGGVGFSVFPETRSAMKEASSHQRPHNFLVKT